MWLTFYVIIIIIIVIISVLHVCSTFPKWATRIKYKLKLLTLMCIEMLFFLELRAFMLKNSATILYFHAGRPS